MRAETIATGKGELSLCRLEKEERVSSLADFLELLVSCPSETLVLRREDLAEAFFDLKSGLAGEFLQKISNYRRRMIVLGDFRELRSRALEDFIRESNGTGKVVFAGELDRAVALLR